MSSSAASGAASRSRTRSSSLSVGVDIGSSTSHLVFSRLLLERLDNRYIVSDAEIVYQSDVLLTPYAEDRTIDAAALGAFIERQYRWPAQIAPDSIDTGALILTGVAVRRPTPARSADLFAAQAGKFVVGERGRRARGDACGVRIRRRRAVDSRERARVMNIDIGGGTSKIAVCEAGRRRRA